MLSMQSSYTKIEKDKSLWGIIVITLSLLTLIAINIENFSDLNTIFMIFRITAIVVVLGMVTYSYVNHKNSILIFLILSISALLASELFTTIFQTETLVDEFSQVLVSVAVSSILLMFSLYFFLLFFESFNSEHIMTKQNLFLLINIK